MSHHVDPLQAFAAGLLQFPGEHARSLCDRAIGAVFEFRNRITSTQKSRQKVVPCVPRIIQPVHKHDGMRGKRFRIFRSHERQSLAFRAVRRGVSREQNLNLAFSVMQSPPQRLFIHLHNQAIGLDRCADDAAGQSFKSGQSQTPGNGLHIDGPIQLIESFAELDAEPLAKLMHDLGEIDSAIMQRDAKFQRRLKIRIRRRHDAWR